jgi:hypothetical protein
MTRYLALFYGDFPQEDIAGSAVVSGDETGIGPIRSGRLPYESIRKQYSGSLVMSGASAEVKAQLNGSSTVFGSEKNNINSALIAVDQLQKIAAANSKTMTAAPNLTGNRFDPAAPSGGEKAEKAWVFYNFYNQIEWTYDAGGGAYLRSQDKADGSGKFHPTTDRLTGEQLAFENVIVLFANHTAQSPTLIDIDLDFTRQPALLFRDGQAYRIFWSTVNGEYEKRTNLLRPIRFEDAQGNPFPMKPGQTWVQIVTSNTTAEKVRNGFWKVRFYAP